MQKDSLLSGALCGALLSACYLMLLTTASASSVHRVQLQPGKSVEHAVKIAVGTACSFKFPVAIENVILGNSRDFKAQAVSEKIVSIKALTDQLGLLTNLQVVLQDDRIITIKVRTGDASDAISQVHFFERGTKKPSKAQLARERRALERRYKQKERALENRFKKIEAKNYIRDILYGYQHSNIQGGKVRRGIGLFPRRLTVRENDRVFLKVEIENRSRTPYRIANLQVMERREGGFLGRKTKEESKIASNIQCTKDDLLVAPKTTEACVLTFTRPKRQSKKTHIGLKLTEAASDSRQVYIRRILEIYE